MAEIKNKESGLTLDIRYGSFCIYKTSTLEAVCTGTLESFRNKHDDMRCFANNQFDKLTKQHKSI